MNAGPDPAERNGSGPGSAPAIARLATGEFFNTLLV
jgi:hypothetical protein